MFLCRTYPAGFGRSTRGGAAVGTAVAVAVLTLVLAGLFEIVQAVYAADRMDRAARAAAQSIALIPETERDGRTLGAIACAAIRRELDLDEEYDCGAQWSLAIDTGLAPTELLAGSPGDGDGGAGDMVAVWIGWDREPWTLGGEEAGDDDGGDDGPERHVAVGVARSEPGSAR